MADQPRQLRTFARQLHPLPLQGQQQAFEAAAEADAGGGAAAELFDEVVVAAAAAEGVLRAEAAGDDFPECFGVVVEPADEAGVDFEGNFRGREQRLHPLKVLAAPVGQALDRGRGALHRRLVAGVLAVEDAQGVGRQPPLGVFAELGGLGGQPGDEGVAVAEFALLVAEAVDLEFQVSDAGPANTPAGLVAHTIP